MFSNIFKTFFRQQWEKHSAHLVQLKKKKHNKNTTMGKPWIDIFTPELTDCSSKNVKKSCTLLCQTIPVRVKN